MSDTMQETAIVPTEKTYPIAMEADEIGAIEKIEEVYHKFQRALAKGQSSLVKAVATSKVIQVLDKAITPLMPHVMGLMNQPSGFLTDRPNFKDKSLYKESEVRPIVIQALMKGLDWHGNKFNIISKRLYITREGYYDLCLSLEGLSSPRAYALGVTIHREEDWAEVIMKAEYFFRGRPVGWERPYRVKCNKGMDADGVIGKGKRRVFRDIYEEVSGMSDGDDLDDYQGDPAARRLTNAERLEKVLENRATPKTPAERIDALVEELDMPGQAYIDLCDELGVPPGHELTDEESARVIAALEKRRDSARG